jgi:hypothetical protein
MPGEDLHLSDHTRSQAHIAQQFPAMNCWAIFTLSASRTAGNSCCCPIENLQNSRRAADEGNKAEAAWLLREL